MITTERLPHPSGDVCNCGNRATIRVTVDGVSEDVCRPCAATPGRYALTEDVSDHPQTCTPEQRANADAGAELLTRAADHLDQLGMHVTVNPWRVGWMAGRVEAVCPNGETWQVASDVGDGDAPWIATMNGHVGEGIVALLRDLAEEALMVGPNPHGVELARRILGEDL